jgi:hypothetical protein
VRGLAHRKHWNPVRQSLHTGGFLLAVSFGEPLPVLLVQCQLIFINKLESVEKQHTGN